MKKVKTSSEIQMCYAFLDFPPPFAHNIFSRIACLEYNLVSKNI